VLAQAILLVLASSVGGLSDEPEAPGAQLVKVPPLKTDNPRYGILTFGPDGEMQAWLLVDGDVAYLDRNGNGDLTEAGERVEAKTTLSNDKTYLGFKFAEITGGKGIKYGVILLHMSDGKGTEQDSFSVRINGDLTQEVGGPFSGGYSLAKRAEDASRLRFDARLTMTLRADFGGKVRYNLPAIVERKDVDPLFPPGAKAERVGLIIAQVGTPGKEASAFVANQWGGVRDHCYPTADLEFRSREPGGQPIRTRAILRGHSCADGFLGFFEVPEGVADGAAKLTLSFPDWEDVWATQAMRSAKVAPATMDVWLMRESAEIPE
jgi:hypothetical protein